MSHNGGLAAHVADEALEQYHFGRLSSVENDQVEDHLLICESCRRRLDETESFVRTLREAASPSAGTQDRGWLRRILDALRRHPRPALVTGLAAAAATAALLVYLPVRPRPPQEVRLLAMRGSEAMPPRVRAGTRVRLRADVTELPASPAYILELVDQAGRPLWETRVAPAGSTIEATPPNRPQPGRYWVRLYRDAAKSELLREYGFVVD